MFHKLFQRLFAALALFSSVFVHSQEQQGNNEKISHYGLFKDTKKYDKPFLSCLKKAKGKNKEVHKMPGVDFIYVITAKKCHRFNDFKRSFEKYNIVPYRFTSISPSEISIKTMSRTCVHGSRRFKSLEANALEYKEEHFKFNKVKMDDQNIGYVSTKMSLKSLARTLSHISVIKDAFDSGYETVWVMDSGTELRYNPSLIYAYIEKANKDLPGWTLLYTDFGERKANDELRSVKYFYFRPDYRFQDIREYLSRGRNDIERVYEGDDYFYESSEDGCNSAYRRKETKDNSRFFEVDLIKGAHSYIINRKGMKIILDWYLEHKIFIPYWFEIQLIPGMQPYCLPIAVTRNQNRD